MRINLHHHPLIDQILNWDYRLFIRCYNLPIRWNRFLRGLLIFGDVPIWIIIFTTAYISGTILQVSSLQTVGLMIFWAIWISAFTLILPKVLVVRKRPYADEKFHDLFNLFVENRDPTYGKKSLESFPSGHCFFTWMAWVVFSYIYGWPGFIILALLAFPMPIFRCNLGVHFPSDVYGGALLGFLTSAIVVILDSI